MLKADPNTISQSVAEGKSKKSLILLATCL